MAALFVCSENLGLVCELSPRTSNNKNTNSLSLIVCCLLPTVFVLCLRVVLFLRVVYCHLCPVCLRVAAVNMVLACRCDGQLLLRPYTPRIYTRGWWQEVGWQ